MFLIQNLNRIGANNRNAPSMWSYTTDETIDKVRSTDYFSDARSEIEAGDVILAIANGENVTLTMSTATTADTINEGTTGWADYVDTVYTSGSPFSIVADTDTVLPNNAGTIRDQQKPTDVESFYDGSVILGSNGDAILITLDCKVLPTSAGTTFIEFWFDIGGAVGELYRRIATFPKGNGVERSIVTTTLAYTLDTWEANGATVYVRANGPADIYDIRYVITRQHKAR